MAQEFGEYLNVGETKNTQTRNRHTHTYIFMFVFNFGSKETKQNKTNLADCTILTVRHNLMMPLALSFVFCLSSAMQNVFLKLTLNQSFYLRVKE